MYFYHVTTLNNLKSILKQKKIFKSSELSLTDFERNFGNSGNVTNDMMADPLKYTEFDGVYLRVDNKISEEKCVIYFNLKLIKCFDFHYNTEENSGFCISSFYEKYTGHYTTSDIKKFLKINFSKYPNGELVIHQNIPSEFFKYIVIGNRVYADCCEALSYAESIDSFF